MRQTRKDREDIKVNLLRHLHWVHRLLMFVAVAIGILMMLHVSADVIARGLFGHSLPAVGEITASYYMIIVAFMPLAFVTYTDTHLSADLFSNMFSQRFKRVQIVLVDLLTIAYLAVIGWQAVASATKRTASNELVQISGGFLPIWPARWLLPIAIFAMILAVVLRLVERRMGVWHDDDANPDDPVRPAEGV